VSDPNQRLMFWRMKTDTGRMKETLDTLRPICSKTARPGVHFKMQISKVKMWQIFVLAFLFALCHFPFALGHLR
jgi:hypothetical protein